MDQEAAQTAIANADLRFNPIEQPSMTVPKGKVISYDPAGKQPKGTTIWIYISTGSGSAEGGDTSE